MDLWCWIEGIIVAVEIDENEHKDRCGGYEEDRYNDLFMDLSTRYVFVRINPDPYKVNGVITDPPFDERLTVAENTLQQVFADLSTKAVNDTAPLVQVKHLFYSDEVIHKSFAWTAKSTTL